MSLSRDGSILAVGGPSDGDGVGATWLFKYNGLGYTQIGSKLVGEGYDGRSKQGRDRKDHMMVGLVIWKEVRKYPRNDGILRHPKSLIT